MGEVLSFGFNLAVLDPSDSRGNDTESALYRLEGGWIGDFYEFFTEEFVGEEIP